MAEMISDMETRLAKKLYRWRGETGSIAFFFLYLFSAAKEELLPIALVLIAIGLTIRALARGYIGQDSATTEFKLFGLITSGIYKLRHPLYLGNLFLTTGVLYYLNLPSYLFSLSLTLFLMQYLLFIRQEERLRGKTKPVYRRWSLKRALKEAKTILTILVIFALLSLKRWKGF